MVWQRSGTVAVQNGSTTVVGTGVDFAASSRVGDSFIGPDGVNYEVANVASGTVISILPAYKGPAVSGAAYAIMPVQGYDKMLSDAFNSLNNQFGPKLAALGTTGNYDILPVGKGGNGNDTGTAAKLASAAIVGIVSQSGGQSTGAIIERGSNANGNYVKFADGTMICTVSAQAVTFSNPSNLLYVWTYPVQFTGPDLPVVLGNLSSTALGVTRNVSTIGSYLRGYSTANCSALSVNQFVAADASGVTFDLFAIGRWYV